jgi:hypothetical protein
VRDLGAIYARTAKTAKSSAHQLFISSQFSEDAPAYPWCRAFDIQCFASLIIREWPAALKRDNLSKIKPFFKAGILVRQAVCLLLVKLTISKCSAGSWVIPEAHRDL